MQLYFVFAQCVAEFTHRLRTAVIEMLRSAEHFERTETSRRNLSDQSAVQRLIQESIGRKYALHGNPTVRPVQA